MNANEYLGKGNWAWKLILVTGIKQKNFLTNEN